MAKKQGIKITFDMTSGSFVVDEGTPNAFAFVIDALTKLTGTMVQLQYEQNRGADRKVKIAEVQSERDRRRDEANHKNTGAVLAATRMFDSDLFRKLIDEPNRPF